MHQPALAVPTLLPSWPDTVALGLEHAAVMRAALEAEGAPYSDWHFPSAWVWTVDGSARLSRIGGLLVLQLPAYDGDGVTTSALGTDPDGSAVRELLDAVGELQLVPAPTAQQWDTLGPFEVVPDPDNHDYVYDLETAVALEGKTCGDLRHQQSKFTRDRPNAEVVALDLTCPATQRELVEVFDAWATARADPADAVAERRALLRCLTHVEELGLKGGGLRDDGELLSFFVYELHWAGATGHFLKARPGVRGATGMTWLTNFRAAFANGARWFNGEQDLGLPGLRIAKKRLGPAHQLHKFTVRPRGVT